MARGVTTEWEDIQVKMGAWKAVEKMPTSEEIYQQSVDLNERYDNKLLMNSQQLEERAEDDIDFDEDDFMKQYREKRLQELKVESGQPRFGSVFEINKQQWEEHITRAPKDVNVVIHLYQSYVIECQILNEILDQLAPKYPYVKFIKAVATKCVEGMLDRDLPALLFYKNEDLTGNIIPAREVLGGKRMTVKTVEFVLSINRILDIEFEHDPRDKLKLINTIIKKGKDAGKHYEDDVDSEGEDDREYVSNQYQKYRQNKY